MSKMTKLLALAGLLAVLAGPVLAQSTVTTLPSLRQTTNNSSTIAVTNTFQSVWAAQNGPQAPRTNCLVQNNGTHTMWVYFGAIASATKASSVVLAPGQALNCATSGVNATSQVSVTGTAGDEFAALLEGAPVVLPPSTVTITSSSTITPKPESAAVTVTAATVGVASAQALASGTRDYLALSNASASAFVACNFGGTAVVNGAGSITLSPYQSYTWEGSFVPSDAVNCIASAAATPFTILSSAQ